MFFASDSENEVNAIFSEDGKKIVQWQTGYDISMVLQSLFSEMSKELKNIRLPYIDGVGFADKIRIK